MKKLNVLVACGAGIATSTVVMKKVEDLFAAIKAMGFLTGLGVDKLQDEILTKAREIQAQ